MARRDEDALSWGGDEDPTLDTGSPAAVDDGVAEPASLPDGWTPLGRGSESARHTAAPVSPTRPSAPDNTHDGTTPGPAAPPAFESSDSSVATAAEPEPEGLGTVALVSLGVLGGVYLLFAIGWLVGGLRLQVRYQLLVGGGTFEAALWLATAAPLIWFATTIFATRKARAWVRWVWLAAGVLLLIPWPFLLIGAVAR